jgi:glycosyltransferase involved in cell wall biosynthesis
VDAPEAPKRRPRIAGVTAAYFPSVGGVERYVHRGLASLGEWADVRVFTSDANLLVPGRTTPSSDVPVRYLPSWPVFNERVVRPRALWSALAAYDPDLIWTQHPSVTGDFAGMFAILHQRPWIATYHADIAPWKPYGRAFSRWEALALARSDAVMVSSERYRSKLRARRIPDRVVRVVPLCGWIGDGTPPPPCRTKVRDEDVAGSDHPLLFVGGLDRARAYKRPELLLVAAERLRQRGIDVKVSFVGDGDRRQELETEVARRGLQGSVEFLGAIPDVELAERYRRAWAFVLPSDNDIEGFGAVCMEAIQYGCPVVTSDAVVAGELLARRQAAIVYAANDSDGLAHALETLWASGDLRAQMSRAAVQLAPEYTWARVLPRLTAPFREAMARREESLVRTPLR